jgi:glycosyltransferase involved in cell wall biosynthesis
MTGARDIRISVLIPVVERTDQLMDLHHSVLSEVQKLGSFEFLYLISAGFEDAFEQALELHEKDPGHVRVLRFARRLGAADALAAGFDRACGDIAITIPSYFDADPAGLGALCAAIERGADMAFAVRTGRRDGLLKPLQSTLFSHLASWATGTHFNDVASATRAIRRDIIRDLPLYGDFHHFLPVLAHGAGFRVVEVPVARDPRSRAPRVYQLRVYLYRALDLLSMFFLSHFTRRPLRLFGAAGTVFGALGAVILLVTAVQRGLGTPLADRPILILGTLLLGLGVQAFTIGFLGELLLFFHVRDVRDYRIAEIYEAEIPPLPDPTPDVAWPALDPS